MPVSGDSWRSGYFHYPAGTFGWDSSAATKLGLGTFRSPDGQFALEAKTNAQGRPVLNVYPVGGDPNQPRRSFPLDPGASLIGWQPEGIYVLTGAAAVERMEIDSGKTVQVATLPAAAGSQWQARNLGPNAFGAGALWIISRSGFPPNSADTLWRVDLKSGETQQWLQATHSLNELGVDPLGHVLVSEFGIGVRSVPAAGQPAPVGGITDSEALALKIWAAGPTGIWTVGPDAAVWRYNGQQMSKVGKLPADLTGYVVGACS